MISAAPSFVAGVFVRAGEGDDIRVMSYEGSAALIGGAFFLSAKHVLLDAIAVAKEVGGRVSLARHLDGSIQWDDLLDSELPHRVADLVVGAVERWRIAPPFNGIGIVQDHTDLTCTGFPGGLADDAVIGKRKPTSADVKLRHRTLRGYATRSLNIEADLVQSASYELSFALDPGMSGAPVYQQERHPVLGTTHVLQGIVTGTARREGHDEIPYGIAADLLVASDRPLDLCGGIDIQRIMIGQLRGIGVPIPEPVAREDDK